MDIYVYMKENVISYEQWEKRPIRRRSVNIEYSSDSTFSWKTTLTFLFGSFIIRDLTDKMVEIVYNGQTHKKNKSWKKICHGLYNVYVLCFDKQLTAL